MSPGEQRMRSKLAMSEGPGFVREALVLLLAVADAAKAADEDAVDSTGSVVSIDYYLQSDVRQALLRWMEFANSDQDHSSQTYQTGSHEFTRSYWNGAADFHDFLGPDPAASVAEALSGDKGFLSSVEQFAEDLESGQGPRTNSLEERRRRWVPPS